MRSQLSGNVDEWAALISAREDAAYLSYRHPTPVFVQSDGSWVSPPIDAILDEYLQSSVAGLF